MTFTLKIKPLSVNQAWQGRRFKTQKYKMYEKLVLLSLPKVELKSFKKLTITYGFSNWASDIDNPTKLIIDILQKKYGVNDKEITELHQYKVKVKKGEDFIKLEID